MEIGPRLHTVRAPGHGPLPRLRVFGEPNSVFPAFVSRKKILNARVAI